MNNLKQHIADDNKFQEEINEHIKTIKENHLYHIEQDLAKTSTNVDWLMKFFWVVAGASIGGLVTGVINLIKLT